MNFTYQFKKIKQYILSHEYYFIYSFSVQRGGGAGIHQLSTMNDMFKLTQILLCMYNINISRNTRNKYTTSKFDFWPRSLWFAAHSWFIFLDESSFFIITTTTGTILKITYTIIWGNCLFQLSYYQVLLHFDHLLVYLLWQWHL